MFDDLKLIRKMYGEDMMHLCRELFPTILETPELLYSLMYTFAPNHYLYEDIIKSNSEDEFKNYIYSVVDDLQELIKTGKTPYELMDQAGYILYECKSEEDIQSFRKYYAVGEELCTFKGGRLNNCHVFFAVKKNVDEIKREDFENPEREDEYGISVISIQFTRGKDNVLSIKNRYNHTVVNPDATYSNNLENIIPGLSASFEEYYGLNLIQHQGEYFGLPGYVFAKDGRYYKYNYELGNVYYCPGNIIIDNFEVKRDYQEKEKYIIADYFIIDLVKKEVRLYDESLEDSFVDGLRDIKKIDVIKNRETGGKIIIITPREGENIVIEIDKFNRIIGYKNNNLNEIGDRFLIHNIVLSNIELFNVTSIGDYCLYFNTDLINLDFPNLIKVGDGFLGRNIEICDVKIPNLVSVGDFFLCFNMTLAMLDLSKLEIIGSSFLFNNKNLEVINLPKVKVIGNECMFKNRNLKSLRLPSLEKVGIAFLYGNEELREFYGPKLNTVGESFLYSNRALKNLNFPKLKNIGDKFLCSNPFLQFKINGNRKKYILKLDDGGVKLCLMI